MEKIHGICTPYGDQTKKVTYIKEFDSFEAGLTDVKADLENGFKSDYAAFSIVLKEFERQIKGREADIVPILFSLACRGGGGYFFSGRTIANDQIAAETHYDTYNFELTENIMRFSVFDPNVDIRNVLTEFSKDKKYEKGFGHNASLDSVIGKYRIACVESSYGFGRQEWHLEGNHPLVLKAYANTVSEISRVRK